MMGKFVFAAIFGVLAGTGFAQDGASGGQKRISPENGTLVGIVSATDTVNNEIIVGGRTVKVDAKDAARLAVGDDVTVTVRKGKATILKAGEKEPPQPFRHKNGISVGPVSAIDAKKNEIVLNDSIFKLAAADIARLKIGDQVTVTVRKGKATVEKNDLLPR